MNRFRILLVSVSLFTAISFISVPAAFGQFSDTFGGFWNNASSATAGMMVQQWIQRKELEKMIAKRRGTAVAGTSATGRSTEANVSPGNNAAASGTTADLDAVVRFRSTGTQLKTRAFADALGKTVEERNAMFQLMSTLLTGYEKSARAGGRPNDVAMAITISLVSNSSIYNGTAPPDDASINNVRDALAELIVQNRSFSGVTDRQKQEMYETLVIFTMLAKYGYDTAQKNGDSQGMATYRELAGYIVRKVAGLPPEQVKF